MITLTRTYTRPTKTTLWHWQVLDNSLITFRIKSEYVDTKKLIRNDVAINGLTATFTMVWTDKSSLDAYDADKFLQDYWTARDAYNAKAGIVIGPKEIS